MWGRCSTMRNWQMEVATLRRHFPPPTFHGDSQTQIQILDTTLSSRCPSRIINRPAALQPASDVSQPPAVQPHIACGSATLNHLIIHPLSPAYRHPPLPSTSSLHTLRYPRPSWAQTSLPTPFAARHHKRASSTTLTSIPYQPPVQWPPPSLTITMSLHGPSLFRRGTFEEYALRNTTALLTAPFPCWMMAIGEPKSPKTKSPACGGCTC